MRQSDKRKRPLGRQPRTTQIILGERKNLQDVVRLLRSSRLSAERQRLEAKLLGQMIQLRTLELNRINPGWDRKVRQATNPRTSAAVLQRLARSSPPEDYILARLISQHPKAPPAVLARLARHPYRSVRENIARHPRTPVATLRALCRERREPLWYLVAFNPSTPAKLRNRLRARIQRQGMRF